MSQIPTTENPPDKPLVLVVDDLADARRMLLRILEREGYEVLEAENGRQAIETFAAYQPDLILMDAMMPILDGFEACRRIKAMPLAASTPIVMVTSLEDQASIQRAFDAGATDYLTKPISHIILRRRVQHLLHSRLLEKRLARRNYVLEQLNRASRAATSSLELDAILREIIRVSAQALDVTSASIVEFDPEAKTLRILAEYISPQVDVSHLPNDRMVFEATEFPKIYQWLSDTPAPVVIKVLAEDQIFTEKEQAFYRTYGANVILRVPFHVGRKLMGYLSFWESRYQRDFTPDDIALVMAIATQVGSSVHHAQLHHALRQSESEMRRYAAELEIRNRELDAYTHSIAHDLKSPLQTLLSYTAMVMEVDGDKLSSVGEKYLSKTQQHIQDMAKMIDQLLTLAQLRDSQQAIEPTPIQPIIEATLHQHHLQLEARGFQVELAPHLPPVMGNEVWIKEIFSNLIGNAIKYIGEQNPAPYLHISAKLLANHIRYNVQDNGIGIPDDAVPHVFKLFTRVHHESNIRGFGLGLAIVKQLVNKMNGAVGVESAVGVGSTFWFTLPIVAEK